MDRGRTLAALDHSLTALRAALPNTARRKRLGAFYTAEDVARYMTSRAVLPLLLRRTAQAHPSAVPAWSKLLREQPERYGPDASHLVSGADQHQRILRRLRSRKVVSVGELISLNVDLERLVVDWLSDAAEPIRATMRRILAGDGERGPLSVLDPTCGDGAFLLEALRTLEPVYNACDLGAGSAAAAAIVRDNLYGVDLLPEAVDACRLRLLLECQGGPSADAPNLRCGNSLSGRVNHTAKLNGKSSPRGVFHWSRDFSDVMRRGGFDVVIGNPPYIEYTRSGVGYALDGEWRTRRCDNLHALVTERAAELLRPDGALAFVIPSASVCTPRMQPLVELLMERFGGLWWSLYDERPAKLFPGVDQQLAIVLAHDAGPCRELAVTPMRHWTTRPHDERKHLFSTLSYQPLPPSLRVAGVIPKVGTPLELELLDKLAGIARLDWRMPAERVGADPVYYKNAGGRYWRLVKSFPTRYQSERGNKSTSTEMVLNVPRGLQPVIVACFSSSLFYWYWRVASNCRHLTEREIAAFPLPASLAEPAVLEQLRKLCRRYERRLKQTLTRKTTNNARSGRIVQDEFRVAAAKPILDEIDRALAPHYGLTEAELDFVINYDLKYRMAGRRSSATIRPAPATSPR